MIWSEECDPPQLPTSDEVQYAPEERMIHVIYNICPVERFDIYILGMREVKGLERKRKTTRIQHMRAYQPFRIGTRQGLIREIVKVLPPVDVRRSVRIGPEARDESSAVVIVVVPPLLVEGPAAIADDEAPTTLPPTTTAPAPPGILLAGIIFPVIVIAPRQRRSSPPSGRAHDGDLPPSPAAIIDGTQQGDARILDRFPAYRTIR